MHIAIHDNAKKDLIGLRPTDPDAVAHILAMYQQIQSDPLAQDKLTQRGDNKFGSYLVNVKEWATARPQGNIWRFRVLDTPATSYRVVYGWHWKTQYLWILAVVHKENKEFDYDNLNAPISARIISDWRSL